MAINIPKQIKNQRLSTIILILGLLIFIAVISIFVLPDILAGSVVVKEVQPITTFERPQINWQVLEKPEITRLKDFEKITPYEEEMKKESPFSRHLFLLY